MTLKEKEDAIIDYCNHKEDCYDCMLYQYECLVGENSDTDSYKTWVNKSYDMIKNSELTYNISHEDIIKALDIIKEVCKENEHCKTCPLRYDESFDDEENFHCVIQDFRPDTWKISKFEYWRAFNV